MYDFAITKNVIKAFNFNLCNIDVQSNTFIVPQ